EASRSTADVVAEAESHKRLVLAVLELPEPYRSTVLLRWFEDLAPRDVAGRTGVPVETARTRLKRAHGMLRARLDRDAGGWAPALPLAAPKLTGGTTMGIKTAFIAASVV